MLAAYLGAESRGILEPLAVCIWPYVALTGSLRIRPVRSAAKEDKSLQKREVYGKIEARIQGRDERVYHSQGLPPLRVGMVNVPPHYGRTAIHACIIP